MEAYGFQENSTSMGAYSDRSSMDKTPEPNQHLGNNITVYYINYIKGLLLGNQNHRTDKLTWRPTNPCHA
eukprot:8636021-Heterocapsa_arctica.AAC.1